MKMLVWCTVFMTVLFGCGKVVMMAYGIRKPEVKTESEIRDYMSKKDIAKSDHFGLSYDAYKKRMFGESRSMVELELFDSRGNVVFPVDSGTTDCPGRIAGFLSNLEDPDQWSTSDSLTLRVYLTGITTLAGESVQFQDLGNRDFTAVFSWATYAGKLNNRLKQWRYELEALDSVDVRFVYINRDFRDFWDESFTEGKRKTTVETER